MATPRRIVGPSWRWLEIPVLDARRCTSCGLCRDICPTACLEMLGALPTLPRPADCVSCSACVLICPTDALNLALVDSPPASDACLPTSQAVP